MKIELTKICTKCGIRKNLCEFHRAKFGKKGRSAKCKKCVSEFADRPESRAKRKLREAKNENKIRRKELALRSEHKMKRKAYNSSLKIREKEKKRRKTPECQAITKKYNQGFAVYKTYVHKLEIYQTVRHDPEDKTLLQIQCALCEKWFNPTNRAVHDRIAAIQNIGRGDSNLYCSNICKEACPVYNQRFFRKGEKFNTNRSDQYIFHDHVLMCAEYKCEMCGKILESSGNAHHIAAVATNPLLSMDIDNGIAVCRNCHDKLHSDINCGPFIIGQQAKIQSRCY